MRELRDLTRTRKSLIADRNRLKNEYIPSFPEMGTIGYPNPFTKKGREHLENLDIPEIDRELLEIYLAVIDKINEEIKKIDRIIVEKAKQNDDAILLTTISE